MNLAEMIAAHDDAALEAIASKGLVRRARRDLEAGLAAVSASNDTAATVIADGQTVHIDTRGLAQSRCNCPAGGICRHILLAAMALRVAPGNEAAEIESQDGLAVSQPVRSASAEICALKEAELKKFAGADWDAAVELADASDGATVVDSGGSCRVEFAAGAISVTFIAGQGLKNTGYKGPKSRARVIATAAAIHLRSKHGIVPETATGENAVTWTSLGADFLAGAQDALMRAVRVVLGGSSPIAVDMLFDLAISARAEAAPRLAAELRRLARMAGLAMARDIRFEPEAFLADAARTFALIEALKSDPTNADLTGSLRRHYRPHAAFDLWMLGASSWRNETGARGVTFHGFAPGEKRWHSASIARAAGQDPSFDPKSAYRLPLWANGQGPALMGRVLHIPGPLVASDGSISITLPKSASTKSRIGNASMLIEARAAHDSWKELFKDLARRFTGGLKRRATPVAAMLAPARFGNLHFNELEQSYESEVVDRAGNVVTLTLPAASGELAQRLHRESHGIRLILVEASIVHEGVILKPIAIASVAASGLDFVNLDLDVWPPQKALQAAMNAVRGAVSRNSAPKVSQADALRDLAAQALAAVAAVASGAGTAHLSDLTRRCQAAGFLTLAAALESMASETHIGSALRAAYLAGEVQASRIWI